MYLGLTLLFMCIFVFIICYACAEDNPAIPATYEEWLNLYNAQREKYETLYDTKLEPPLLGQDNVAILSSIIYYQYNNTISASDFQQIYDIFCTAWKPGHKADLYHIFCQDYLEPCAEHQYKLNNEAIARMATPYKHMIEDLHKYK